MSRRASLRGAALSLVALLQLDPSRAIATGEPVPAAADEESAVPGEQAEKEWSASAEVNIYVVPDDRTYAQPTLAADYKWLHLEARYNYEALDTGSAWLGFNFAVGDALSLGFTPMVGGVFGNTTGVAPGYELTLDWWKLELYSEGEYLFDTGDSSGDFTYTWSELSLSPVEWARLGMVAQRTRAYQTDVAIQRGLLVGASYKWFSFTTYVFDLGQSQQTVVLGLGAEF